jgi:hypothetical protein
MEASEKHQPELGLTEGAVRALDDRLFIDSLTVNDGRAARVVRERAEADQAPAETVRKAIEIGTRVLDTEETAANVDYVRHELGELDRRLGTTLEAGATDLAERIASVFGTDRNDSVQAQIKEIVGVESRQQREALTQMLTAEDGSNPLVAVQARLGKAMVDSEERHRKELERLREAHGTEARAMQVQVGELRKELARLLERDEAQHRVSEAEEAGTRKGRTFEELVHIAIEAIATGRGDAPRHVGDERGDGGGKKGDSVVEIGAADGSCRGRVVFEAKDKKLSKQDAWRELDGAIVDRSADFGVLVVAGEDRVPSTRQQLNEYEGNKLIVAVDRDEPGAKVMLEAAYRLARARVLMARERSLAVDAAGVQAAAEKALSRLKELQKARLGLTGIADGAERVRETIDAIDADVRAELQRIESLIAAADQSE